MNSLSKKRLFKGVISLLLIMILGLGIISVPAMATDDTTINLEDEYINLAEKSGYTVNPETKVPGVPVNKIKINSEEVNTENLKLTKAGDYSIELGSGGTTYKYNVILYRRGDANIDSSRDVRDLVAMYKTEVHTKESEIRGADTNGDGNVDATDRSQIRQVLVEKVKPVTFFDYTDYTRYDEAKTDVNALTTISVETGKTYTLSFNYYVKGSGSVNLINAAKDWHKHSDVAFSDGRLTGDGTYTHTFTADYTEVIPVFETHIPYGTPKFYVWDMQLVEEGSNANKIGEVLPNIFKGDLVDKSLITVSDIEIDELYLPDVCIGGNTWLLDFLGYKGENQDPNAHFTANVESGSEYTFSFKYCVMGKSTGTKVINAAKEWSNASSVGFDNNVLSGKGEYTTTFTADSTQVIPAFQTHTPYGTPQLYIWDIQLVKKGTETNLVANIASDKWRGSMMDAGLVTISDVDTDSLQPPVTEDELEEIVEEDVWLFDFLNYTGEELTPNALITLTLDKGSEYTFSFEYHVQGNGTPKLINAAKEWQGASSIVFPNNALTEKGTYTFTFTADHTQIIPVFQTHTPNGKPQLYVWNMQLVKTGSEKNLFADVTIDAYRGHLKDNSLISITKMDPTSIGWPYVWMFDFAGCTENYVDLNAFPTMSLEKGSEYTLSFDYCSEGIGTSSIINASEAWHKKSTVTFPNNRLTGKGTYTFTFVADLDQIIPVFQAYKGTNAPRLYVWNLSLFKTNSTQNLMADLKVDNFGGNLKTNNLLFRIKADTNSFVDMPVDYNTAILYNRQSSSYDVKAEARRNEILAMTDTVRADASKTTYYVSPNGNDNNDGTSKASAWRTLARVAKNTYNKGDAILFERGGVYRGNLVLTTGVKYGAYGSGSKPCIYGSAQNYARPWLWEETDQEYVWKIHVGEMGDIGNIVFNHGVKCGWKMLSNSLVKNFDFYHDVANRDLYLYYTKGNPGAAYDDIEICSNAHVLHGKKDTTNVTIENLCIKYGGAHGIVFNTGGDYNIIQGCEIGYIGGSLLADTDRDVRYGNGIEMLDNFMYTEIKNNWVYQCYDAGITQQSSNANGCTQRDSSVSNNLIEYCSYNIEYYVDQDRGLINDTVYENNILRFAGYGFGSLNRIGSDNSMDSNICSYVRRIKGNNFVIQNNVFDSPKHFQTTIGYPNDTSNFGPKITQNTYIQQSTNVAKIKVDGVTTTLTATDLQTLKDAIAKIDSNPKSVIWDE